MRSIRTILVIAVVVGVMALMGSALAQTGSSELPEDEVQGDIFNNNNNQPGEDVLGTLFPGRPGASTLPLTGADLTLFVGAGVIAIAAGSLLVRRTRAAKAER
ncbi:MAG: LPXTG cell wall anchor domain-containing protein [Actinomycetota bacterium]